MNDFQIRYREKTYGSGNSITRDDRDEVLVSVTEAARILELDASAAAASVSFRTAMGRVEFIQDTEHALLYGEEDPDTQEYVLLPAAPVLLPGREELFIPLEALAVLCGKRGSWNEERSEYRLEDRPDPEPDMTFYLTRHGRTWFNTVGRVQGWCDSLLTEEGEEVAADLGLGLTEAGVTFAAAYSGDLGRQRQTARIVLDAMEQYDTQVQELTGLREVCFGDWEGEKESYRDKVFCDMTGAASIFEIYRQGDLFNHLNIETDKSGTAETAQQAFERMMDALYIIREENREERADGAAEAGSGPAGKQNILIISSGGAISGLVRRFGYPGAGMANAAVTYIDVYEDLMILKKVGDTSLSDRGREIRKDAAAVSSL